MRVPWLAVESPLIDLLHRPPEVVSRAIFNSDETISRTETPVAHLRVDRAKGVGERKAESLFCGGNAIGGYGGKHFCFAPIRHIGQRTPRSDIQKQLVNQRLHEDPSQGCSNIKLV